MPNLSGRSAAIQSVITTFLLECRDGKLDPSDALFHAGLWDERGLPKTWPCSTLRLKTPTCKPWTWPALPAEADTLRVLSGANNQ